MPAAQQSSATTFEGFEERRYTLRIVAAKASMSPQDQRPQHEFELALVGSVDPDRGGEIVRRMWTSTAWNDAPEKTSHQYLLARALCGPSVTLEQWEALDYPDLVGRTFSAFVKLNGQGWPTVDKDSIKSSGGAAGMAAAQATPPPPATPPKRPAPPARPAGPEMITPAQAEQLAAHALKNFEMGGGELAGWVAENFGGKAVAQLTAEEANQAIETLAVPF